MYEVTTRKGFTGPRRRRAGIEVPGVGSVRVELDAEQLKALRSDPELVVTEVKDEAKAAKKTATKKLVDEPESKEA